MDSRRYRRYFVILDGADEGFNSRQGKKAKGYAKIEMRNGKGMLNYYVQNLKYFEEAEWIYRGYLIGTKKGKLIYVQNGMIVIDKNGKGELNWKFDVENVDGKGNSFDEFNVIAIIAENVKTGIKGKVNAPLVGFIDKQKVEWKHAFKNESHIKQDQIEQSKYDGKPPIEEVKEDTEQAALQVSQTDTETKEVKETPKGLKNGKLKEQAEEYTEDLDDKKEMSQFAEMAKGKEIIIIKRPVKKSDEEEKNASTQTAGEIDDEDTKTESELKSEPESTKTAKEQKEEIQMQPQKIAEEKDAEIAIKQDTKGIETKNIEAKDSIYDQYIVNEPETNKPKDMKSDISSDELKEDDIYQKTSIEQNSQLAMPNYNSQYFKMVCGYVQNVLKHYPKTKPFEKDIQGCDWWKITYNHQTLYRHFMPFYGYLNNMGGNPYMNYAASCSDLIYKYQHYIFGIKKNLEGEIDYYLYGIPGRFILSEQPDQGMTGFVYWHPLQDKIPERGEYGYWILHIDPKTGNVAMPLDPTLPPRY